MAPEIRWGVLRAAVAAKAVPGGCLGLLAYLFIVEPQEIKSEELAGVLHRNKKTIQGQLRQLEQAGFIAVKRSRHGKTLELLAPSLGANGVQTVKLSQKDASFLPQGGLHEIGKIGPSGGSREVKEGHLELEKSKGGPSGNGEKSKIGPSGIEIGKIGPSEPSQFLLGMLEALENGSKPENMNPVCPDNNETASS
jgi:hypothetical protein